MELIDQEFGHDPTEPSLPASLGNAVKLVKIIDTMAEAGGIHPVRKAGVLLSLFDDYQPAHWAAYAKMAGLEELDPETIHTARGVYLFRHRRQKRR